MVILHISSYDNVKRPVASEPPLPADLEIPLIYFTKRLKFISGPGSSVSIATGYRLDGRGDRIPVRARFSATVRPALRPTKPPVQWVPGLSRG